MADIALREASDADIACVFRPNADHIVGTVDGVPAVYIRFQTIEGRRWGMLTVLSAVAPAVVPRLFYALRGRMLAETEPVYALRQYEQSARLLRLLRMEPTGEVSVGKEVWVWTPRH